MTDTEPDKMTAAMVARYGKQVLKRTPTCGEVYGLCDVMTEGFLNHKAALEMLQARIEALEKHGIKYAGVYQKAQSYQRGNVVTHSGSMWVALRGTTEGEAPGTCPDAWQLSEKVRKRVPAGRKET